TFVGDVTGGAALNDGKWHHVALSLNRSGNATLFYDTMPIYGANITSVSGSLDNTADLYIGKDSTGNNFKGTLDDVIIYKDFLLDLSDIINRRTGGPEFLAITSRGGLSGLASLFVLNDSADGDGLISGILDSSNNAAYPLKLWNQASYSSGSDTVYNLISFGNYGENYGNLIWDATNTQFIFDQSLKTTADLSANFLNAGDNQFLAFAALRHTLIDDDVSNSYFTEPWSKATKDKIVSLHGIDSVTGGNVIADQDWWTTNIENRIEYDGTNIRVDRLGGTWNIGDVITIFIVLLIY
ncbi:MAG: LamG domain-containing protein, partial [Candidatus Parcubacteria bacterium]|nr:LamG domain-containing protein [Candidatus Parcubacteria bacterium]